MPGIIENHASTRSPDSRSREVRDYLAQLLASPQFAASGRRGQLLQYLVQHTLAGDADRVTEYAIGLDVFQKPTSFNPQIESVVRTEFSRLRQKLKDYYAEEGRRDRIVIDFPPRSYAASFEFRDPAEMPQPAGAPQLVHPGRAAKRPVALRITAVALAFLAPVAVAAFAIWREHVRLAEQRQPINALVVLPFENYSPDHQDEYIADGITEELTNDLAQWRDLRVVARTSAFAFKGKNEDVRRIGQQLNVDAVLEGSFTREGDRMRITAQLNRTTDGYHLWSHSYEIQSDDLLAVQEQAASSIVAAIRQLRGGAAPEIHAATTNPQAHDLYLQGVYQSNLHTPDSTKKAAELFQAAVAKDPAFARAWVGLSATEMNLISLTTVPAEQAFPVVREAAQRAIDADPNLGEAWGDLAVVTYWYDWNWERAAEQFRHALELGAGSGTREDYGWSLETRGRFAEAHEQLHLAEEQDPLSVAPVFDDFFAYNFERDVAGQEKVIAQLERLQPNFVGTRGLAVVTAVQQGDCGRARRDADWVARSYPTLPAAQAIEAYAAACEGKRAEALERIGKAIALGAPAYQVAIGYVMLDDADDALAQLSKSAEAHEEQILYLRYDPFFDDIRSDPRYVALEKRVGLM